MKDTGTSRSVTVRPDVISKLQWGLHILVLLLSAALIYMISVDSFRNLNFYQEPGFLKWQFWICMVFLAIYFIDFALSHNKWHYLWSQSIFLIVSIPYQALIDRFGIQIPDQLSYLIRYMPLIRGGYAMAYVVSWLTRNKATGLFFAYVITLLSTVYFCSLTFYMFELRVNPMVQDYADSLWWACMTVTTEGCDISAVTGTGRALSVLLALMGIILFPVFTVYVTDLIHRQRRKSQA